MTDTSKYKPGDKITIIVGTTIQTMTDVDEQLSFVAE